VKKRIYVGAGASALIAIVALATMVSGAIARSGATPLPASSCSAIQNGSGQILVASDLPLEGSGRAQTTQMTRAIKFIFNQHGWKAGKYSLAYQSCDDATAQAGKWDSGKCSANANAYAQNSSVGAVIGTFNSGCAEIIIPVLNRAPDGPVAMISPANTYVGLTHSGPGTAAGEPDKYYPSGKRNYIRIVAADDFQGAADALNTQQLGLKNVFILNDKQAYGLGVATDYRNALTKLGIKTAGFSAWNSKASSYTGLATQIKQSGADAVFIGGLICETGGKLIKDLVSVLGKNVTLMAPDGFTPISAVVSGAGNVSEGMYISVAGEPNEKLGAKGKAFVKDFGATQSGGNVDPYAAYAAQSAEVLLKAIADSDGTRADVAAKLLQTNVTDGILGSFKIDANGDTNSNPVTVYQIKNGKQTTYKTITPPTDLVKSS
jgi:branched-chain amino acid transport system substrate-binding protein